MIKLIDFLWSVYLYCRFCSCSFSSVFQGLRRIHFQNFEGNVSSDQWTREQFTFDDAPEVGMTDGGVALRFPELLLSAGGGTAVLL